MEELVIRQAMAQDEALLAALQYRSMRALAAGHYSLRQIDAFLQVATPALGTLLRTATVWLAWSGPRLAGSAAWHPAGAMPTLGLATSPQPRTAAFRNVFVDPDWGRRGVASLLMDRCEEDARVHGAVRGELYAMLSAVAFYESRGYAPMGETVFNLGGVPLPGVEMTRNLVEPASRAA